MPTISIRNTLFGLAGLALATSSTRITSVAADVVVVDPAGVEFVQGKYVPRWELVPPQSEGEYAKRMQYWEELVQLTPDDAGGMSGHLYKTVNLVEFENHVKQEITEAGDASQVTKRYGFSQSQGTEQHEIRILHAVGPNFGASRSDKLKCGFKEDEAAGFMTLQRTYGNIFQRFADFVGSKAGQESSRETGSGPELRLSFISGGLFKGAVQDFEKKAIDAMAQAWYALPPKTQSLLLSSEKDQGGCSLTLYTLDTRNKAQKLVGEELYELSQAELIQYAIANNMKSSISSSSSTNELSQAELYEMSQAELIQYAIANNVESSVHLFKKLRVESKSWSDDLASL